MAADVTVGLATRLFRDAVESVERITSVLGAGDLYGHLYHEDLEALADALDERHAAAHAAHTRPKSPGEVVSIDPETRRNPRREQGFR